jgi:glycosyltransferase involved in cell wall biosynthesis
VDRPRVSIFLPSLAGGGAERSITTVANGLAERGAQVSLVLATACGPYLDLVNPAVQVVDLGAPTMLRALPHLVRHLRRSQPAALLAAMSHANVAAALAHRLAGSRARLVLSERVHVASLLAEYRSASMRATYALMRLTYPWADQLVAVSQGVAEDLRRRTPVVPERVVTIYNPVVDDRLLALAQAAPAHHWLKSAGVPVVLAAGRLIAQKDFATLIAAFAHLRRKRLARLLILGEGELREPLLALAAQLGVAADVAMPGFDSNPFAAMHAAQVFVLSSRFEGLPGVLIQAMACGARVVSTDCPSGPREVLESGRWGALVPVGDVAALGAALAAALDNPSPPDVRERAGDFTAERAVAAYAGALGLS